MWAPEMPVGRKGRTRERGTAWAGRGAWQGHRGKALGSGGWGRGRSRGKSDAAGRAELGRREAAAAPGPAGTHAWMDSVTEPIWLTFSSRQLQAFFSTAWAILLGLVTVRSSPTIWMFTPERNEVQVAQSSWSKGSSMETTGGGEAGARVKVRGASRGDRPEESGWGFPRG